MKRVCPILILPNITVHSVKHQVTYLLIPVCTAKTQASFHAAYCGDVFVENIERLIFSMFWQFVRSMLQILHLAPHHFDN